MHPLAVCARGLPTTLDSAQALAWWKTISGFEGEWPAPLRAEIVWADKINEIIFYFDSQQARNTVMAVRELEYASLRKELGFAHPQDTIHLSTIATSVMLDYAIAQTRAGGFEPPI